MKWRDYMWWEEERTKPWQIRIMHRKSGPPTTSIYDFINYFLKINHMSSGDATDRVKWREWTKSYAGWSGI
eukprot:7994848-Karenia_brevis.AAC.1